MREPVWTADINNRQLKLSVFIDKTADCPLEEAVLPI